MKLCNNYLNLLNNIKKYNKRKEKHGWTKILGGFILSLVSIPQAYLRRTSDENGSNFSVSRLLCNLGNACSSKPPNYTFKSRSTRLTSLLTLYQNKIRKLKHQSNCNEISRLHLVGNWIHAHLTQLLISGPRFTKKRKEHGKLKLLST